MTEEEVHKIKIKGENVVDLIETHISWVLIGEHFVYKLKKPVKFSFVDFSSIERRKQYCIKEIELNNRLTHNIYLEVIPILKTESGFIIGTNSETVVDYAVKMTKQNVNHQMHLLLEENKVSGDDILKLAKMISDFHMKAKIIETKLEPEELKSTFNDISTTLSHIELQHGKRYSEIVKDAMHFSDQFLDTHGILLMSRSHRQMIRDCHGDLHSGNIFIEETPIIFDCIEFNPAFRQIDLLYEIAFFCMDLDSFGRRDLSKLFLDRYLVLFPEVMETHFDKQLFIYYKLLRANIKVKILALKEQQRIKNYKDLNLKDELKRYLRLMLWYHHSLKHYKSK